MQGIPRSLAVVDGSSWNYSPKAGYDFPRLVLLICNCWAENIFLGSVLAINNAVMLSILYCMQLLDKKR